MFEDLLLRIFTNFTTKTDKNTGQKLIKLIKKIYGNKLSNKKIRIHIDN